MAQLHTYFIKKVYRLIRNEAPKVPWRRFVCNNKGVPKWLFVIYLALHRRLQNMKKIACWVNLKDTACPLCQLEDDNIDHMMTILITCSLNVSTQHVCGGDNYLLG